MDQQKIGNFLKELRKEKNLTQEQFAEIMGVSNRSVSRWETGTNMPDLALLMEIADYYKVELRELLDGERTHMDPLIEETVQKVADYSNREKMILTRRMHLIFIGGIVSVILYLILDVTGLKETGFYENIAGFALGLVFGILILGTLFTSRSMAKIRAFKQKLLNRK